jgi:hypothetical protein
MTRHRVAAPRGGGRRCDRLSAFENNALRRKLGPRRVAVQNCGENCIVRRFVLCIMALWRLMLGAEFCHMFFSGVEKVVQKLIEILK